MNKNFLITLSLAITTVISMHLGIKMEINYVIVGFLTLMLPLALVAVFTNFSRQDKLQYLAFIFSSSAVALIPDFYLLHIGALHYTFPMTNEAFFWPLTTFYGYVAWLNVIGYPAMAAAALLRGNLNLSLLFISIVILCIFPFISSAAEQVGIWGDWWRYDNMAAIEYGLPYFVAARYVFLMLPLVFFVNKLHKIEPAGLVSEVYKNPIWLGIIFGLWTFVATFFAFYLFVIV